MASLYHLLHLLPETACDLIFLSDGYLKAKLLLIMWTCYRLDFLELLL